jgi:4-hydroxythreonine-4-phosphate dehydrogenase
MRVALATTHLPLHAVAAAITREGLERTLRVLRADLVNRFAITQPRIIVAGLNPHAGESGHLGREEIEVITPVLEHLRNEGFHLIGPLPAVTLGLPIIRTSVDHGTALELAGTGKAKAESLVAAVELAAELALRSKRPA